MLVKRTNKINFLKYVLLMLLALTLMIFASCSNQSEDESYSKLELSSPIDSSELILEDTLTVATYPGFPPFTYQENGMIKGFDVDFAQMLADSLGLKLDIIPFAYNEILYKDAEQGKKFDTLISNVAKTSYTKKMLNCSNPYYMQKSNMCFIVKKNSNITEANLNEAINNKVKIAVAEISSFRYYLLDMFPNANYVLVKNFDEAVNFMKTNEDSIVLADDSFIDRLDNKDDYKIIKNNEIDEEICACVSKNNPHLIDSINEVIAKRTEDGTLEKLNKKYDLQ